jgi:putative flippase GtrA
MKRRIKKYFTSHSRTAQFLRFATVGAKVSAIDAGGVYLLPFLFGMNLYVARLISLSSAILIGYLLNRYFTFGNHHRGPFFRQMVGHVGVFIMGGLINYGVFTMLVKLGHQTLESKLYLSLLPLFALWMGGLVGMAFNFVFSKLFVFRHGRPCRVKGRDPEPPVAEMMPSAEGEVHR